MVVLLLGVVGGVEYEVGNGVFWEFVEKEVCGCWCNFLVC